MSAETTTKLETEPVEEYDVIVIGSGFGGLGAALELSRQGASVALFERLKYPGGCASTFTRRGHSFESGATLFSGFGEQQLFGRWIDELGLDVDFVSLDPIVEMRTETFDLQIGSRRESLIQSFEALDVEGQFDVRGFFARQKEAADALWYLFDDPDLLPPFGMSQLFEHIRRAPKLVSLLPLVGQSLDQTLHNWGVGDFEALRTYLNAISQITIQASVNEAETLFALASMDYYFRGTGHIHGGIGKLAWAIVHALEERGVAVHMADAVTSLEHVGPAWQVSTRRRMARSKYVVANLLPQALEELTGRQTRRTQRLSRRVESGWGAAMLYLSLDSSKIERPEAHHLELVADNSAPFIEGNHLFVSIGGDDEPERAPEGRRTATVSTHVPMPRLTEMNEDEQSAYIARVQQTMRETLKARAPEIAAAIDLEMTASPRTFERFTQRPFGYVGGIPRRVGLDNYRDFLPTPIMRGLYLVGDTVFPGQSTLATAIGGVKVAQTIAGQPR